MVVDGVCEGCCVSVFSEFCAGCAGGSEEGVVAGGSVTGGVVCSGVDGSVGVVGVSEEGVVGSGVGSYGRRSGIFCWHSGALRWG